MLGAGGEEEESMMDEQMLKTVVKVWGDNEWREVSTREWGSHLRRLTRVRLCLYCKDAQDTA